MTELKLKILLYIFRKVFWYFLEKVYIYTFGTSGLDIVWLIFREWWSDGLSYRRRELQPFLEPFKEQIQTISEAKEDRKKNYIFYLGKTKWVFLLEKVAFRRDPGNLKLLSWCSVGRPSVHSGYPPGSECLYSPGASPRRFIFH
jgi:hypothetical protein